MGSKAIAPPKGGFLKHTRVARLFDMSPITLKRRVERGLFPVPFSVQPTRQGTDEGAIFLYREEDVSHRLKTGHWPPSVRYQGYHPG